MKTTHKILDYLSQHGSCGVSEISLALGLTKADIRYHLGILLKEQKITIIPPDVNIKQLGRPAHKFQNIAAPSQVSLLVFLEILCNTLVSQTSLEDICEEIWIESLGNNFQTFSPISRLEHSVTFLKRIGVEATWIAGKTGPQFKVVNNPYKERYPRSCQMIVDTLIQKAIRFAEAK